MKEDLIEVSEEYLDEYSDTSESNSTKRLLNEDHEIPNKKVKIADESEEDKVESTEDLAAKKAYLSILKKAEKQGKLEKINSIEQGKQKDSTFINKILEVVFGKQTLATSSAQGQRYQSNPSQSPRPALDANLLDLCKRAFYHRIKQEEMSTVNVNKRLNLFNSHVNTKVQNARKCYILRHQN